MIDETFSHPYIYKFPENVSFLFGRIFKSVNFFWDTRYSVGSTDTTHEQVIFQLLVNFIPDHATKHWHFIVSNFRKTFHLFLEYGELPAIQILQITFNLS